MPTKKPRIYVTLEPEVHEALREFQEASGTSPASFISQVMTNSLGMLRGLTRAAKLANEKNLDAFDLLQEQLLEATHKATQMGLNLHTERTNIRRAKGTRKNDHG